MTEASTETVIPGATGATGAAETAPSATGATGATGATATAAGATGATGTAEETPTETIARLEADVKAARAEAGKQRINAKATAAEEAKAELAQTIGKALGLVQDEPVDPAKLAEQVATSTAEAATAKRELAVFHAAAAVNADAAALLDSRAFMTKVAALDPTDPTALAAAITEAVTANPAFALTAERRAPNPNPALGSSASGAPDLEAQIAQATKAGDVGLAIRLQNQKLVARPQ